MLWVTLNLDKLLTLFYSKNISKYDTTLVDYLSLVVFIHAAAALNLIGLLLKPYLYSVINRKYCFSSVSGECYLAHFSTGDRCPFYRLNP